jgi:deazaflavin-dependent oxidoreductase (nitroreductase family)
MHHQRSSASISIKGVGKTNMDATIEHALQTDGLIDMTTIGKKTGKPHKIEIVFHNFDGVLYITGSPGRRDWYANLLEHPQFTFHLKQSTQADIPATATPITDEAERRQVLSKVVAKWNRQNELEAFVQSSPLVKVQLEST